MLDVTLAIICGVLLIVSFVGIFVPAIPDVPLAWAGLMLYAWGTGFSTVLPSHAITFTIITVVVCTLDIIFQFIGAKKLHATKYGFIGILAGLVIGLFIAPIGTVLFPIIGAFIGEYIASKDAEQAVKSALGSLVGFLCGSVFKAIYIIVMAFYFIVILL